MNKAANDVPAVAGEGNEAAPMRLLDNALDGFRNGACLDLRVRFAMELLTHSPILEVTDNPKAAATEALDTATELFALAYARGLIEPLDSPEIAERLRDNAERIIPFQASLQVGIQREGQRIVEEAGRIARSVTHAFPGGKIR